MNYPPQYHKLSVVMPVYNEARTLRTIISRILNSPVSLELELICVDDASSDHSWAVLQEQAELDSRIKLVRHDENQGKGAAVRTGIEQVTGEITLIQDADLEYDPGEYTDLIAPIVQNKADAVFGSRFASAPQRRVLFYWHSVANHLLTWTCNVLNDLTLSDMETCYKAVRSSILKQIPLKSKRFNIEPELTTRLAQWNLRLYEVPISYHGRTYAEGKKIRLWDAFEAIWSLLKYRFFDTRFTTHDGYYILESVRRARGFNKWMLRQFDQYVGERVLEAGCGIGNFTEQLLNRERLVCVDIDPLYVEMIGRRFGHLENLRCQELDLARCEQFEHLHDENLDSIISLNVIEHIEDDVSVLQNMFRCLVPGGHVIILVPAHAWLYSKCDETLGHFRRYAQPELGEKIQNAGFELVDLKQYNRLGVLGWYVNKLFGRADLSPRQMKLYELMLPIAKLIDGIGLGPGLSLIAIGRKPTGPEEPPVASGDN